LKEEKEKKEKGKGKNEKWKNVYKRPGVGYDAVLYV